MKSTQVLAVLSAAATAYAAVAPLDPIGFQGDGLTVITIGGTGSLGTTYVLNGTDSNLGFPVTVTIVEGSQFLSETAVLPAQSLTVGAFCSFTAVGAAATEGLCTLADIGPTASTTAPLTAAISPTAIPIISTISVNQTANATTTSTTTSTSATQLTITSVTSPTAPVASPSQPATTSSTSGGQSIPHVQSWATLMAMMAAAVAVIV